jgi:hypothetical protein
MILDVMALDTKYVGFQLREYGDHLRRLRIGSGNWGLHFTRQASISHGPHQESLLLLIVQRHSFHLNANE